MKTTNPILLKLYVVIGFICMLIPFSIMVLWIHSANINTTHTESVAQFHSYFPEYLQGRYHTAFLSLILSTLAILLCSISLSLKSILWKGLNIIILIISSLLWMLNLFQMM